MTKYFVQFQHACKVCKRPSVDIVTRSDHEGLIYSGHFPKDTLKFCTNSFGEFVR